MRLSRFIFGFLQFAFWAAVAVVIALALLGCIVFLFESRKMQVSGVLRFAIIVTSLAAGVAAVLWWDERCRLRRLARAKADKPDFSIPSETSNEKAIGENIPGAAETKNRRLLPTA